MGVLTGLPSGLSKQCPGVFLTATCLVLLAGHTEHLEGLAVTKEGSSP